MIHSSSMCSPGPLPQKGKCFSINYFDEAKLRAQRAGGTDKRSSTFCSAVTQPHSTEESAAKCLESK